MIKPLTAQEKAIIQQAILDRWNPHRLTWKIANHFDLSVNQIRHIKSKATFKAEYARQLAIYQGSFDEIQLGHRKERVGWFGRTGYAEPFIRERSQTSDYLTVTPNDLRRAAQSGREHLDQIGQFASGLDLE